MTLQEIFNKALYGLRKQGVRSRIPGTAASCAYSTPHPFRPGQTLHCAVGHLLTPEALDYLAQHDGMNAAVSGDVMQEPLRLSLHLEPAEQYGPVMRLLDRLQAAHDSLMPDALPDGQATGDLGAWERRMAVIADHFQLEYPLP